MGPTRTVVRRFEASMKPALFQYHAPKTVAEAVALLAEVAPADGRVLAGGQSLVPTMAFRLARPAHLVDINGIAELDRIAIADGKLVIGACVRHAAFYRPVTEGPLGLLLARVVRHIAHHPIRTRGTFCGSLVNADPASEWCLVAATLGAEMVAQSRHGARVIGAVDFFEGVMTTALQEDELLVEARLSLLSPDTHFGFYEFSRRAGDFAIAMALATYRLEDGRMVEPRLGIGGAEPKPRRIVQVERMLEGQAPGPEIFARAAQAAAKAVEAMDDSNYSADYRRDLVETVTRRALDQAAEAELPKG
jgi:carbon-monoxide dehydrogenase medium subunit